MSNHKLWHIIYGSHWVREEIEDSTLSRCYRACNKCGEQIGDAKIIVTWSLHLQIKNVKE